MEAVEDAAAKTPCAEAMIGFNRPDTMLIQWHVTERCNQRCSHCYQKSYSGEELDYEGMLEVLEGFKEFLRIIAARVNPDRFRAHLTVTGGEPFIRSDFMDLLQALANNRSLFTFAILTNGTLIERSTASEIAKLKPSFVQVSLDGGEKTHDRIRGAGSFEKTLTAIRRLVGKGVRTFISFTANRDNFLEFPVVADIGKRLKVARVWADRYVPPAVGQAFGADVSPLATLSPRETFDFFSLMHKAANRKAGIWPPRVKQTEIAMQRGLQFLVGGGTPYRCTAGERLLAVLPDGDVYPCRRMPLRVGNVLHSPLIEIYDQNPLLRSLRDRDRVCEECRKCFFVNGCRGGSRCLSYALTGNPFSADPGCWLHSRAKDSAREWMQ